jgi:hypothetical protein
MTHDAPESAAKPAPYHIAFVVCGHMQRGFGFKVKAEVIEEEVVAH